MGFCEFNDARFVTFCHTSFSSPCRAKTCKMATVRRPATADRPAPILQDILNISTFGFTPRFCTFGASFILGTCLLPHAGLHMSALRIPAVCVTWKALLYIKPWFFRQFLQVTIVHAPDKKPIETEHPFAVQKQRDAHSLVSSKVSWIPRAVHDNNSSVSVYFNRPRGIVNPLSNATVTLLPMNRNVYASTNNCHPTRF